MPHSFSFQQELARKSIHLMSFFLGWALLVFGREPLLIYVTILGVGLPLLDIARRKWFPFIQIYDYFFKNVTRPGEKQHITGAALMFIGIMISVWLFDPIPAAAGIFFICFGDSGAAIVGSRWGSTRVGSKTLEGTLTFILICILITAILPEISIWAGILAAVIAGLIELSVAEGRYDNLIITPVSSLIIQFIGSSI